MSDPFKVIGWALQWHTHICGLNSVPNMNPPRYSSDFPTVREIVYDENAHYGFHFLVRRTNRYVRLFTDGAMLPLKSGDPVFMDKNKPDAEIDPREAYVGFDPAQDYSPETDEHHIMLYWPMKYKSYHEYGTTRKFLFRIGYKNPNEADNVPPRFTQLPLISVFISDVIPKN